MQLNRRNAIVYMHPLAPLCCGNLEYGAAVSMLEYDFDVTRGVVTLIVNGVMFRYPNIRFITVHSGGTVPTLAGRMNDRIPRGAEQYLPTGYAPSCASGTTTSLMQAFRGPTAP